MKHRHPTSSNFPAILLFIVLAFAASTTAAVKDTLLPGQSISGSETLTSKSRRFELGFFAPTGYEQHYLGIRYRESGPIFRVRDDFFHISPTLRFLTGKLYIEELGSEFVLWSSDGTINGSSASVAILLDTGNFVVRDGMNHSVVIWQSFWSLLQNEELRSIIRHACQLLETTTIDIFAKFRRGFSNRIAS